MNMLLAEAATVDQQIQTALTNGIDTAIGVLGPILVAGAAVVIGFFVWRIAKKALNKSA